MRLCQALLVHRGHPRPIAFAQPSSGSWRRRSQSKSSYSARMPVAMLMTTVMSIFSWLSRSWPIATRR
jgi:hypothetical protein